MVTFKKNSVDTIIEAIAIGRAQPGRWIFQPGH